VPLFRRSRDEDAERRQEETLRTLEAGGIPPAAQERLDELRRRGGGFFTSDLSVPEFLLVREAGFRPLTQVLGSCFYNVGYQWLPYQSSWLSDGQTVELEAQTSAWNDARALAVGRLAEEARRAGADAVVGVHVERGGYDWAAGLVEFVAVGTAVVSERHDLGEGPVLSNLSGQDFAKLFAHGYWPVGLVAGSTVCYVMAGSRQQWRSTGFASRLQNQELPDFTQGLYDARAYAMNRVTRQAHELGAHGVVGVQLQQSQHERERSVGAGGGSYTDLVVTLHVLGTAIAELERSGEQRPVYTALPLDKEIT
jgi:uncharacterized protein YbjQ (UPF0145 family)